MKQHLLALTFCALSPVFAAVPGPVTAAEMNGTWKTKGGNEFKIWKIGKEMLRVEFFGVFRYDSATGPTANTGEGQGVASLEGDTAKFKPDGAEDDCAITLKFSHDKLMVTQTGTCGFGFNVTAEGTYEKVSSREPKFDSGEGD
jgi:hypothetical protein